MQGVPRVFQSKPHHACAIDGRPGSDRCDLPLNAPPGDRRQADRDLFGRYQRSRDPAAHEALVRRFLPLVEHLARRYRHTSEPYEDLVQAGSIGLLSAIERYDPEHGAAFSSFAVPTITGEIKHHFRDRTWAVKVPRKVRDAVPRMHRAEVELTHRLGRSPTAAELADSLDITVETVIDARAAATAQKPDSLDRPRDEADGSREVDLIQVEERGFRAAEDAAAWACLLAALPARERTALQLYFEQDLTQAEVAERIGCSQMHASRVIRGAITRLRSAVEAQEAA